MSKIGRARVCHVSHSVWVVISFIQLPHLPRFALVPQTVRRELLERTQPGLPLGIGHIRTKSHDYIRHGTTTLFAALEYASGKVVHAHHQTHTHREWLSFLRQIWRIAPKDVSIEIVADNYATHKHAELEKANDLYIARHNEKPRRFVWKAEGEEILRKINKARKRLGIALLNETNPASAKA